MFLFRYIVFVLLLSLQAKAINEELEDCFFPKEVKENLAFACLKEVIEDDGFDPKDINKTVTTQAGIRTLVAEAAARGWLKTVEYFVSKGADVNKQYKFTRGNALHGAADQLRFQVVKALVEKHKADIDAVNRRKETALYLVMEDYRRENHYKNRKKKLAIFEYLLEKGADPHVRSEVGTVLREVIQFLEPEFLALLIKHEYDFKTAKFEIGFFPVSTMALENYKFDIDEAEKRVLHMMKMLKDVGVEVPSDSAIRAIRSGRPEFVKAMLALKGSVNFVGERWTGSAAFDLMVTPLIQAIYEKNTVMAKYLIGQGADVDMNGFAQYRPPSKRRYFTALTEASSKGLVNIVDFLLSNGANPGLAPKEGPSPLEQAIENSHFNIAHRLIEKKAPIEHTLLRLAIHRNAKRTFLETLLNVGKLDPKKLDQYSNTQLWNAAISGNVPAIELLVERGVEIDRVNKHNDSAFWAALRNDVASALKLLSYGANPKTVPYAYSNFTTLTYAIHRGKKDLRVALRLIENKLVDINEVDADGRTALGMSIPEPRLTSVTRALLRKKVDLHYVNQQKETYLFAATRARDYWLVWQLLGEEVDYRVQSKAGRRAIHELWGSVWYANEREIKDLENILFAYRRMGENPGVLSKSRRNLFHYMGNVRVLPKKPEHMIKFVKKLNKLGVSFIQKDASGFTPIELYTQNGKLDLVKLFVLSDSPYDRERLLKLVPKARKKELEAILDLT